MAQANMALVKINYLELALPVQDACKMIALFEKAQKYEENYIWPDGDDKQGKYVRYLGGEMTSISMSILENDKYQEALNNGPKPKNS